MSDESSRLIALLETLPAADEFLEHIKRQQQQQQDHSSDAEPLFIVPHLQTLHRIVYELLPKPNKGLWEEGLQLDPFLLTYFALMYVNVEKQLREKQRNDDDATASEDATAGVGGQNTVVKKQSEKRHDNDDDESNFPKSPLRSKL